MTALEKFIKEHPERKMNDNGIPFGCPDSFGYLPAPDICGNDDECCVICWNREIPKRIEERLAAIPEVEPDEIDKQMIEAAEKEKEMSMTKNVDTVTIDYKAEYERLNKIMSEQLDNASVIRQMEHDIETKDALIEEQRIVIDKLRTVIRCVEAFLGKEFLYC